MRACAQLSWWNTMMAKNAPDMAWMRCVGITMGFPVEGLPVDISSRLTAFHALRKKVHLTTVADPASTICLSIVRVLRVRWCARAKL